MEIYVNALYSALYILIHIIHRLRRWNMVCQGRSRVSNSGVGGSVGVTVGVTSS